MATAKIVLFKMKMLNDGSHPIYLTLTIHRNRRKYNLNRSCHSKYWDFKFDLPGELYPEKYKGGQDDYKKSVLTDYLKARLSDANTIIRDFEKNGKELSFSAFEEKFHQRLDSDRLTIYQFFEAEIKRLQEEGRYGYSQVYVSALNAIKKHFKRDLHFIELTPVKITSFIKTFRARGANGQTISVYLRTFRTLILKAIDKNWLFENPISNKIITDLNEPTSTRGLTLTELRKLYLLDLSEYPELVFPRDMFFASFYLQGMSFADLAEIRYQHIKRGEINYIRRKTGKPVKVVISEDAMNYINKYRKPEAKPDDFVFPVLNKSIHIEEDQKINRIRKKLKQVNTGLKDLAKLANIDPELSSYWARHSFALRLLQKKANVMVIKESLGHTSLEMTSKYLKQFPDDLAAATNDLLELGSDDSPKMKIQPKEKRKAI